MKRNLFIVILLILMVPCKMSAQTDFTIVGKEKTVKVPFEFINNLMLIPVNINGQELKFILDTGVSKSLLFNVISKDSVRLNQAEKITIKGLGKGKYFSAIRSKRNFIKIGDLASPNFEIYLILNEKFDFSSRVGMDVNGLIGTDLLKDFVVEINFLKKKLKFTKPENYRYKKCKKCHDFELFFQNSKPYIEGKIKDHGDSKEQEVRLLVDSGASEPLWLLYGNNENIKLPQPNIDVFIGKGLSGDLYGKKGKLQGFKLGNYEFENVITSYPDSLSLYFLDKKVKRDGTFGSELLKRFHVRLDYPKRKITLKKNSHYKDPFHYDKSGLEIIHNGKMLVKETNYIGSFGNIDEGTAAVVTSSYNYAFKRSYKIAQIKEDSPAAKVGLKKDDIILEVNNKPAYEYSLQQLIQLFSSFEGRRFRLLIKRNEIEYTYKFRLEDPL